MSISLVHIRLETVKDQVLSQDISYTASHFKDPEKDTGKASYAEVLTGHPAGDHTKHQLDSEELEKLILTCRGHRKVQEIIIETFLPEDQMASAQPESALAGDKQIDKEATDEVTTGEPPSEKEDEQPGTSKQPVSRKRSKKHASNHDGVTFSTVEDDSPRPGSGKMRPSSHSPTLRDSIHVFSGNPAVERTEGIIHLFKDNQMTSLKDDLPRSEMICMLAVPATLTSRDLIKFVAPMEKYIENMRILRDATPNQYMVLVKFKSQKYADEFYNTFNNQSYNSIEPEICHLIYVSKVETVKDSEGAGLPIPGKTELPTCPVCLERMDESVDGILTILCNHSFHANCLSQWGDTSCPVCRYLQTPEPTADNQCLECNSQESLWICLICGHVGCGRYVGGHAYQHFIATSHTYSMQLGSQRVWDYAGDNYVHRLVQNKSDGKLVEVDEGGNPVEDEKLDSLTLEYTYLLTSQLESQRRYFEEKIEMVEKEAIKQQEEIDAKSKKALEECAKLEQKLSAVAKDKSSHEKKCSQLNAKLAKATSELSEEKEMNKCLQQNQSQWQHKVSVLEGLLKKKDQEIADLQEQLRDVMFYLEAQQKLSNTSVASQEEIKDGQVVVGPPGGATGKQRRKKGR